MIRFIGLPLSITNTLFQIPGRFTKSLKTPNTLLSEITRILNEAQLDTHKYTQDIYNIAIAYGATFEDAVSITNVLHKRMTAQKVLG